MDFFNSNSLNVSQSGLNYTWKKIGVISENISHLTTPNYKAKYVDFETQLKNNIHNVQGGTSSQINNAINNTNIVVKKSDSESLRLDGNNVNYDAETVEMARTQIQYQYLVRQVSEEMTRLSTVINGR